MKKISIAIAFFLCFIKIAHAQSEIDFTYGLHLTKSNFKYSKPVTVNDEEKGFQVYESYNFALGLSTKIAKQLYFKNELGLFKTNTLLSMRYEEWGTGDKVFNVLGYHSTTKTFLSTLIEYRIPYRRLNFKVFGGPLIAADLINTVQNTSITPITLNLGAKLGAGIFYDFGKVSFGLHSSYIHWSDSYLFGEFHPRIRYQNFSFNWTITHEL